MIRFDIFERHWTNRLDILLKQNARYFYVSAWKLGHFNDKQILKFPILQKSISDQVHSYYMKCSGYFGTVVERLSQNSQGLYHDIFAKYLTNKGKKQLIWQPECRYGSLFSRFNSFFLKKYIRMYDITDAFFIF